MIIVGFVLLAAAAAVAIALIVQNPATVTVHAFKWSWDVDMRWLIVAGLALTAIGLLGLAMMRLGGAHYARLRRERKALAYENKRLVAEQANAAPTDDRPPGGYPPSRPAEQPTQAMPPARPAPPMGAQRTEARPPAPARGAAGSTSADRPPGGVAAPERDASTSTEPHGFRERLAATRHRHVKE
ncbi:MAG TPA: LapA family protein [Jatrophihabitantaceae bacterium]|jgi:uncharacterized integral membrane protein